MEDFDEDQGFTNEIYRMFFQMNWDWPCLSFDVIKDEFGASRTAFPHKCLFVSGTQAAEEDANQLIVTNIQNLQCTRFDDEIDDESHLADAAIKCSANFHPSTCNRVRSLPSKSNIVATWSDTSNIFLWDINTAIRSTFQEESSGSVEMVLELETASEGYGLAWSKVGTPMLAAGDTEGNLYILRDINGTFIKTESFRAHSESVEDIVFSSGDAGVFATCSCDGSISIWDSRDFTSPSMTFKAHDVDVNVIDWNSIQRNLLASGDDSGKFCVWDLRMASTGEMTPSATFSYHEDSITSIEWNPNDECEIAVASSDGRVTIWDLSVEAIDPNEIEEGIPDQMMFEHFIEDPKELHYHPQVPSLLAVTGETFDVFIPDIVEDDGEVQ